MAGRAGYPHQLGPLDRTAISSQEAERILRAVIEETLQQSCQQSSRLVSAGMRSELLRNLDHGHFADRNRDGLVERMVTIARQQRDTHGQLHTVATVRVIWDADRTNGLPLNDPRAQTAHYGYEVHTSTPGGSGTHLQLYGRGHVYFPEGFDLPHARNDRNETIQENGRRVRDGHSFEYLTLELDKWARGR